MINRYVYCYKTGIGQIDQVFSGFKTGNHDNYSYTHVPWIMYDSQVLR
jgi:hypothetical protein